ncbi:hypothetical protein BP5796_07033 [Coleophoma crateriformis]|uniref:Transcription factor domain-containing protein n=1 Tax=Coleophoma crateriformis TaxID=565419 RepID=A0A3D8RIB8_9HELO|nr:hypothetical protein BP5796_07033 [Coleophoma crateriformis]
MWIYTERYQQIYKFKKTQYIGTYVLPSTLSLSIYPRLEGSETELIPYFFSVVLPSLPAFGIDFENLRGVIIRLAMSDDSAPSQAVRNSLLALAALYMLGSMQKASRFIAAALNSLRASAQKGIGLQQGMQHIIAGMLLCSFEVSSHTLTEVIARSLIVKKIHTFSQSSSIWLVYLSGTKAVMNRFHQHGSYANGDQSLLFQWVFYYDTLARLGIKHWRGYRSLQTQLAKDLGFGKGDSMFTDDEITRFGRSSHRALEILSELCTGVLSPDDPRYRSTVYISWLDQIENQLASIRQELEHNVSLPDIGYQSESVAVKELFVLAALLYMERKAKQLVGTSSKTDKWIEDAFLILSKIDHCNKPFPLFIFGFDARTDLRRRVILEVIDRTIKKANARGLVSLRFLLLRLWIQDDLNAEGNLDLESNSCFFLSKCNFVPCLL